MWKITGLGYIRYNNHVRRSSNIYRAFTLMPCLSLALVINLSSTRDDSSARVISSGRRIKDKFKAEASSGRGSGFEASADVLDKDDAYWLVSSGLAGACDMQVSVDPSQAVF